MNHLFCFGYGYIASRMIHSLNNFAVSGTKRFTTEVEFSDISKLQSQNSNNKPKIYTFDSILKLPEDITHILISIPPTINGDVVYSNFLPHIEKLKNLKWIGYFSTTGVYGNHNGNWVTEETQPSPQKQISANRLVAETQWLSTNLPVHIFRLSGIYGPQRNELDKILSGKAHVYNIPNHVFSRIYVDDVVQLLSASMNKPTPKEIYNLADQAPSSTYDVVQYACHLLKREMPPFSEIEQASDMLKEFFSESRCVSSNKILEHLKVNLKYPTYKDGLEHLMRNYYSSYVTQP